MATQTPAVTAEWKAPVSACGPLCAIFREGWHPFPNQHPETKYAAFVGHVGIREQSHRCKFHGRLVRPRAIAEDEKKSGIKNRRQVRRPVRLLLPAVRAVTGVFREFQSGVKIEGTISLLRSTSPRAYSHKKKVGVMPDIDADFEGKGEFISYLAPSRPPAIQSPSAVRSEFTPDGGIQKLRRSRQRTGTFLPSAFAPPSLHRMRRKYINKTKITKYRFTHRGNS